MHKHLKKLTNKMYLLSGVILIALIFGVWLFFNAFLNIKVSPRDAIVTVDGEQIETNDFGVGKGRFPLGSHLITVEADGYVSYVNNVKFKRGFTTGQKVSLSETPEATQIAEGGKFIAKGNDPNEFFYLGNNDSTIYRSKIDVDDKGGVTVSSYAVTKPELFGINEIVWSPKKDLALFKKDDGVYMFDFNKYDFVNQTETPWGTDIGSIAWSPDNSKIAYYYAPANGEKSLIFSSLDNQKQERILNLSDYGIGDPILSWSADSEWLLLTPRNEEKSSNKIYLLNAYTKEFKAITEEGNNLDAIFTPDGNQIIFSTDVRESSPQISQMLRDGTNIRTLNMTTDLGSIAFLSGQNNILASESTDFGSSIFKFDLANNTKRDFAINFTDGTMVSRLATTKDDKVMIYENSDGIFAMPMGKITIK